MGAGSNSESSEHHGYLVDELTSGRADGRQLEVAMNDAMLPLARIEIAATDVLVDDGLVFEEVMGGGVAGGR